MATKKLIASSDEDVRQAQFEVNAALFEELGERLVSKPEIALAELVKNSYDADAKTCTVGVSPAMILVKDDGHGMTEQVFLKRWMVISDRQKGLKRFSPKYRRSMAGSKGIGRFSARYLGQVVQLTTTAFDEVRDAFTELTATFDWTAIDKAVSIEKVIIDYRIRVKPDAQPGTEIKITAVRHEAQRTNAAKVRTEILRLTDPFAGLERPSFFHERTKRNVRSKLEDDPGFSLVYTDSEQADSDASLIAGSIQSEILNKFVGRVRIDLVDEKRLHYQVFWDGHEGPVEDQIIELRDICRPYTRDRLAEQLETLRVELGAKETPAPPLHTPIAETIGSPLLIDLRFFPRRKGTFAGLGVDGRTAHSWIAGQASFAVIDNGFPMAAYASEALDWLEINKSKARNERSWQSLFTTSLYPMSAEEKADPSLNPMLALPRGSQILGRVYVATSAMQPKAQDGGRLQPNMDRESLRDNDAFRLLWHVSRFAAELIGHFDRKFRREKELALQAEDKEKARVGLTKAIADIRTSNLIAPEYKAKIVAQLKDAQMRIDEVAKYERESRVSLELLSLMGVLAGFMTHEFEKALHTLGRATALIKKASTRDEKLRSISNDLSQIETSLAGFMDYSRLFVEKARSPRAQAFKVKGQLELIRETLSNVTNSHAIQVEIDVASQVVGPHVPIAAYNGIATNLISNALKSLVPKVSGEDRLVRIHAFNENQTHYLVISDNGIGIPDHLRDRIWDPLYTTTANDDNPLGSGLGLGLTLVQRVVKNLGGKIELMDIPPPNFATAFKVSLPL